MLYAFWNRFTRASASDRSSAFWAGISRSSTPMDTPPRVAKPNPNSLSRSRKWTVSARPALRYDSSTSSLSCFFFIV